MKKAADKPLISFYVIGRGGGIWTPDFLLPKQRRWFVATAHFLDYFKSYGASKKYKPTSMGCAVVTLHARDDGRMNQKKVSVELFN